jgi:hypothetical protein
MEDEMSMSCNMYGRNQQFVKTLIAKPEEKRSLQVSGRRWEDNINMDLKAKKA